MRVSAFIYSLDFDLKTAESLEIPIKFECATKWHTQEKIFQKKQRETFAVPSATAKSMIIVVFLCDRSIVATSDLRFPVSDATDQGRSRNYSSPHFYLH